MSAKKEQTVTISLSDLYKFIDFVIEEYQRLADDGNSGAEDLYDWIRDNYDDHLTDKQKNRLERIMWQLTTNNE